MELPGVRRDQGRLPDVRGHPVVHSLPGGVNHHPPQRKPGLPKEAVPDLPGWF